MFSAVTAFLLAENVKWISCKITASGMESVADDFAMCAEPAVPCTHSPEGNTHLRDTVGHKRLPGERMGFFLSK